MEVRGVALQSAVVLSFTLLLACLSPAPALERDHLVASHGGAVAGFVSLVDHLRAAGATVEPAGEVSQAFFSVPGRLIRVNRGDVQVFEYPDALSTVREAESVSPDGGTIGTVSLFWVAPPHFYKANRLIVLYVGSDRSVLSALGAVLGRPFAGR